MEEKAIATVEKEQTPLDKLTELYSVYQKNVRNISAEDLEESTRKLLNSSKKNFVRPSITLSIIGMLDWLHYEDEDAGKKALDDA